MEVCRRSSWLLLLLGVSLLATTLQGVQGEVESEGPSESECRPYIEKALKELETAESGTIGTTETGDSKEDTAEVTTDDSDHQDGEGDDDTHEDDTENIESVETEQNPNVEQQQDTQSFEAEQPAEETDTTNEEDTGASQEQAVTSQETEDTETKEDTEEVEEHKEEAENVSAQPDKEQDTEEVNETKEDTETQETDNTKEEIDDTKEDTDNTKEEVDDSKEEREDTKEETEDTKEDEDDTKEEVNVTKEEVDDTKEEASDSKEDTQNKNEQVVEPDETTSETQETEIEQGESVESEIQSIEEQQTESTEQNPEESETNKDQTDTQDDNETKESNDTKEDNDTAEQQDEPANDTKSDEQDDTKSDTKEDETIEEEGGSAEIETAGKTDGASTEQDNSASDDAQKEESKKAQDPETPEEESTEGAGEAKESVEADTQEEKESESEEGGESAPEEELSFDVEIPSDLRDRNHVEHLLKVDEEASETEKIINRVAEITLKELKKLYENAIKPLEVLYKYRDLSNRHFGDAEIFSKPLILFMGPWSGGKSSIINYLLDNEYNETSLRTGAEPSPAYFNILMYGDEPEILDGTQLAADFTFSGLQKFGQGLEERLRGVRLPNKLLDKVNIVEIPGILEVRKQVSRVFPFNDACQWFIDRADIIFLVYDPSKLDVGPETEAILDQLKGREHQTRIILNKADQVKPEELMRVQGALIWNISPLMSSAQPPIMYTTSLWSRPYESWAPARLLQAQERAFLRDLRSAIDKRIENKIASARRFAVRVRNHAKMVDCYLTTYYNHKSVFGNRKQVADEIIEHPQDYHIYEGLSTLTNISRYDLPDPDVYRDFFKLNPLYDFQQLSATCTYFRGCPINRLDVAIAYDLPELVGKHKRLVENALAEANQTPVPGS